MALKTAQVLSKAAVLRQPASRYCSMHPAALLALVLFVAKGSICGHSLLQIFADCKTTRRKVDRGGASPGSAGTNVALDAPHLLQAK
jgi:hypothetical protein